MGIVYQTAPLVHRGPSRRKLLTTLAAAAAGAAFDRAANGQLAATVPARPAAAIPHDIAPNASPRFRAVAERLLIAMAEHKVPGAALGILADGREEHAAFGVASIETKAPVAAATRFQIGSLTKTYTGTAVMRLIGEGKLDLYAPVRSYLPDLRLMDEDVAARLTVRHLLTHTGDWWGDDASDTGNDDGAIARHVMERLRTFPQLAPLGSFVSYNNTGFILLGRLIEVATGLTYRAAVEALVLGPLGMTESTFAPEEIDRQPHAVGHGPQGTTIVTPLNFPRNIDPAGGLWSTTRDQLRYARFHLGDGTVPGGTRLLAPYTLDLMRMPQMPIPGLPSLAMGLPWFVHDLPGLRLAMHGGDTFGQHTAFVFGAGRGFASSYLPTRSRLAGSLSWPSSMRRRSGILASAWTLRELALWRR